MISGYGKREFIRPFNFLGSSVHNCIEFRYGELCHPGVHPSKKHLEAQSDFVKNYNRHKCKLIRVDASDEVRLKRGFSFQKGVDDAESECALDDFNDWDLKFCNNDVHSFGAS